MRLVHLAFSSLAIALFLIPNRILDAQEPTSPSYAVDSGAVIQVVNDLFRGMRTRDTALMRAQFHPSAEMRSAFTARTGMTVTADQVDDWLKGVAGAPDTLLLDERITAPVVRVDGNFASVWTPYEFWLGSTFSHCGADLFSLARTAAGWKVAFVADSRHRAGCATRPAGLPMVAPFPQPPRDVDSARAVATVLRLLDGMRTRDTAQMRRDLEGTVPMRVGVVRDGAPFVGVDDGSRWVAGVGALTTPAALDERIAPPMVEVDGNLAQVSAYYEFRIGDQFSHCGMDQFVLGRMATGWKVIGVAYSVRRSGCPESLVLDARGEGLRDLVVAERAFARYADSAGTPAAFLWALRDDAITLDEEGVHQMRPTWATRPHGPALLSWAPTYADIASDGTLGVTSGPWEWRPARDSAVQRRGQFLTIWRRDADRWQVALDLGVSGDSTADLTGPVTIAAPGTAGRARLGDLTDLERRRLGGKEWVAALRALCAPGVRVLRENTPLATGPAAIEGASTLRFHSLGGTVATSGDLGATWGTWKDGDRKGSYVRIWKRTADGWRVAVDRMGD